jgi:aubergine-like protein
MFKRRCKKRDILNKVKGRSVLANYGNHRIYKITDIAYKKTPRDKIKDKNISFKDYYYQNYNIKIREMNQPLLVAQERDAKVPIYLVPELCKMTGLEPRMRKNESAMNKIA